MKSLQLDKPQMMSGVLIKAGEYTKADLIEKGVQMKDVAEHVSRGRAKWVDAEAPAAVKAEPAGSAEVVPRASAVKKSKPSGDE